MYLRPARRTRTSSRGAARISTIVILGYFGPVAADNPANSHYSEPPLSSGAGIARPADRVWDVRETPPGATHFPETSHAANSRCRRGTRTDGENSQVGPEPSFP